MLSTENNNKDMMKMIDMTKKKRVVVKVGTSTLLTARGFLIYAVWNSSLKLLPICKMQDMR